MKRKHSKKQHDLMTSSEKLKKGYDIFETFITQHFNDTIQNYVFPESLKMANIKAVYKEYSRNEEKKSFRLVNILPNLS